MVSSTLTVPGVVDKHITSIEKKVFESHKEGLEFMEDFLKNVSVYLKGKILFL